MKKRTVALLCAAVMLLGVVFGGTMALLSHSSEPLTNTFSPASINLTLRETTGKNYIMAPGAVLDKDPTVTVDAGSASCWLFVKVEERNNAAPEGKKKPVTWEIDSASGWKKVEGVEETVYYRTCSKSDEEQSFPVLKDSKVTISDELTKGDMEDMKPEAAKPQLVFTAYAIQQDWLRDENGSLTNKPAEAWKLAKDQTPNAHETTQSPETPEAQEA